MIEERAAAGIPIQRPAKGVLNQTGLVLFRGNLPHFFQADAVFLRFFAFIKAVFCDDFFRERAADAFTNQSVFGKDVNPRRKVRSHFAFARDAHVANLYAFNGTSFIVNHGCGSKAWIYLNTQFFSFCAQPAADIA